MHVAHLATPDRVELDRAGVPSRERVDGRDTPPLSATAVCLAVLLVGCSLSLIDGLVSNVVAYERDTAVFYYPLMVWASQQLHVTGLPLWTPQIFGGYPIFADGEIGLAYPPALLALLALPPDRAFVLLRLLHLFIAAAGCFALARSWSLSHAGATVAGLTFALGSFLQAQMHHENIVRTAAWLPLVLASVETGLGRQGPSRLRWTLAAGLALGLAGLSLHSQVLAIDLLAVVMYGVLRIWAGPIGGIANAKSTAALIARVRAVSLAVGGTVAFGLGLAAVQILPLLELAHFSPRGGGIPYADAAAYSVTPFALAQVVVPFLFRGEATLQWGLWTHWESYLYVGLAPLLLAVLALVCIWRREVVTWGIIGLLGLVLALGQYSPLNLHYLLWLVPGLSGLRAPGRFTLLVILSLAMLAAHGLSWLELRSRFGWDRSARRRLHVLLWILLGLPFGLAALLIGGRVLLLAFPDAAAALIDQVYLSQPRDVYPLTTSDVYAGLLWATSPTNVRTWAAMVSLLALAGVLWLFVHRTDHHGSSSVWPLVLVGATLFDLVLFSWSIHPRASLVGLSTQDPAVQALRTVTASGDTPFRVLASPVLNEVASDRLAPLELQDANGYSSLESTWHRDYLSHVLRTDDQLLDLWNVRYIFDPARLGRVPSYRDVRFLVQQPLLQGVRGSSLGQQTFRFDSPVEAVEARLVLALMDSVDVTQGSPVGEVVVRDVSSQVLATYTLEAGRDVMDWAWEVPQFQQYVRHGRVEAAGVAFEGGTGPERRLLSFTRFDLPSPGAVSTVEIHSDPSHGELAVYGMALLEADGTARQLFGRRNAKYREVSRDAAIAVFENTAAFPRAFVVAGARTAPNLGASFEELVHRPFRPDREVILAADTQPDVVARLAGQSPHDPADPLGAAQVVEYATDRVRVEASASQPALLVLSDSFYPGWRAFVDGQEQPVLRGDLLFRVVPLPAGQHEVEFRFDPSSIKLGLLLTGLTLLAGALVLVAAHLRR